MEFDADQLARLKDLGLSDYARRAYLSLLRLGTAEARAVSEAASIPPAKVYATLDLLKERGLVEVTPLKPRKYTPVPMEAFFDRQLEDREDELERFRARREEFVDLFPITGHLVPSARARMLWVAGRRNVLQHFREGCVEAEREIFVRGPASLVGEGATLGRLLDLARARGVDVHVASVGSLATDPGVELVALATFDARLAVFAQLLPGAPVGGRGHETALSTTESGFVGELRAILAGTASAERPGFARGEAVDGVPSSWFGAGSPPVG